MNPFLRASAVLAVLIAGALGVAVLEELLLRRSRGLKAALAAPFIEAASLFRQEDLEPKDPDPELFRSAPYVTIAAVALAAMVIPLGPDLVGQRTSMGVFYFLVLIDPVVVALMNAGWGHNGRNGLFATFRAAAQLIAYVVPLGFASIGPIMAAETFDTQQIVERQGALWYFMWQPLGLAIYLVSAAAASYRRPFDIPQAGSEIEGGALAEYSGARLFLFKLALNALFLVLMAMGVVLFFGGWRGPWLPGPFWMVLKTFLLAALVLWGTTFFPRIRHDQMLGFAWKVLLPASLVNFGLVGGTALLLPKELLQ